MSMTKDQFFEEIFAMVEPREAELEEHYYYEMNRRRELYLDHLTQQVMAKLESHWFSADFEAWMNEQTPLNGAEVFIAERKVGKTATDMEFDLNGRREDQSHQKRNDNFDLDFI